MKGALAQKMRSERLLAFTFIGNLPLALDGAGIFEIDTPSLDEPALDLFEVFGVSCPLLLSERRVVRLGEGEDARSLLLGERVELGAVSEGDVLPAPAFLAGLGSRSGLLGFVRLSDTLYSLFDPARVSPPDSASSPVTQSGPPHPVSP